MASEINAAAKEERERSVFLSFARCCGLHINCASVASRQPPEPDIYCELETGEPLRFELVEVLDNALVSNIGGDIGFQRALNEGALELSIPVLEKCGVLVGVDFDFNATDKKKRAAVPTILNEAAQIPADFEGRWPLSDPKARRLASRLFVTRGGDFESEFHVSSGSSFADPIIEKVRIKGQKKYASSDPIELLAYYDRQPVFPGTMESTQLRSEIRRAVAGSQFSRVWVCDLRESRVFDVEVNQ